MLTLSDDPAARDSVPRLSADELAAPAAGGPRDLSSLLAAARPSAIDTANRKNMMLLIQLRWIAVAGQIITIAVVQFGLGAALPLVEMSYVIGGLVTLNLASLAWMRGISDVSNHSLFLVLLLDVTALTAQLYLSGGATNPFTSLFLLQAILAAVLLDDAWSTWTIVLVTCAGFAGLTEFYRPLAPIHRDGVDMFTLQIVGTLACFALNAALLVVFVTRITGNLRARDAHLAALQQHAIEEDHIVRMGLLASGAAHELGTPLSSLSVILGDWRRMPIFAADRDMSQEIEEMQAAVLRCKTIVTGILISAGEARGDAPIVTTIRTFLDGLIAEWRAARGAATLSYDDAFGTDMSIVSDPGLKHIIFNVLDNAYEASPDWVRLSAARNGDRLVLKISDAGPGFTPEMLAQFGKPYRSNKGRLGGGLGLFLVVNVVRKLGGAVSASNRPGGGAVVTLDLPLFVLAMGGRGHAG